LELCKTTFSDLDLEGEIFDFSETTILGFEILGIFLDGIGIFSITS